jgi:hypothetical protein
VVGQSDVGRLGRGDERSEHAQQPGPVALVVVRVGRLREVDVVEDRADSSITLGPGEPRLSEWMAENAFACWTECRAPWGLERELLRSLSLPLNLQHNGAHPFYPRLQEIRRRALGLARAGSAARPG